MRTKAIHRQSLPETPEPHCIAQTACLQSVLILVCPSAAELILILMNRTSRNRLVAWLGMAAMWLAIVAPVISQTLASRQQGVDPQAAICSADALAQIVSSALSTPPQTAVQSHEQTGHHMAGADSFDVCSYCGLLAHNVPLTSAPPAALVRVERVTRLAAAPVAQVVYVKSFNAASPRAPPIVS